jgi:hypothetical protein
VVMCGQDGPAYMGAFAGRTKQGIYDRLYPEHGLVVDNPGNIPPVNAEKAAMLFAAFDSLPYSGHMTMTQEAKSRLDEFWLGQPKEVRSVARLKKNLMLDAYLTAFGQGSMVADLPEVEIAIKIFLRQLVMRRVFFTAEVPDRVGFYIGQLKALTEKMKKKLAEGYLPGDVAMSRRDFETATNAYRDNEVHWFSTAWKNFQPQWLQLIQVKKQNGRSYGKYIPMED